MFDNELGKWFEVDFNKLAILLLPTNWRKSKTISFAKALILPLGLLHNEFLWNGKENKYKINHNFQKCYLQKALNDAFDMEQRRITIDEDMIVDTNYIYTHAEVNPKYMGVIYLHPSSAYASQVDFVVNMNGANADVHDVRALVDFYKIYGVRYSVNYLTIQQL